MKHMPPRLSVLDEQQTRFIQKYVSINIATHDGLNIPAVTRAFGCRVIADRPGIRVYICAMGNDRLIRNLQDNGAIAAVFSRPTTHETLQLKATDARVVDVLADEDRQIMLAYKQSMIEELASIGYPPTFVNALVPGIEVITHGIEFTPSQMFEQTPGPNAGRKLS